MIIQPVEPSEKSHIEQLIAEWYGVISLLAIPDYLRATQIVKEINDSVEGYTAQMTLSMHADMIEYQLLIYQDGALYKEYYIAREASRRR